MDPMLLRGYPPRDWDGLRWRAIANSLAVTLLVATSWAQETVIRSETRLVLVPATVTKGKDSVRGLRAEDFEIVQDGRTVAPALFEEIKARLPSEHAKPSSSESIQAPDIRQDSLILVIDFFNVPPSLDKYVRGALVQVAERFQTLGAPVTVLALSNEGLHLVHAASSPLSDFVTAAQAWTSGDAVLLKKSPGAMALERAAEDARRPPTAESRREVPLTALQQLLEAFRAEPGRKKLIWIGLVPGPFISAQLDPELIENSDPLKPMTLRVWQTLAEQNFAIYAIVPPMLGSASFGGSQSSWDVGWNALCGGAGPTAVFAASGHARNVCDDDPPSCVRRFVSDSSRYYLLGFYLRGDVTPGWHKIKVRLKRRGMKISARQSFFVGSREDSLTSPTAKRGFVRTALMSPLDYTSLPVSLSATNVQYDGATALELAVRCPPGAIGISGSAMNLEFVALIRPRGQVDGQTISATLAAPLSAEEQRKIMTAGFHYRQKVHVPPGTYHIRVVLLDNTTGLIGTASTVADVSQSRR